MILTFKLPSNLSFCTPDINKSLKKSRVSKFIEVKMLSSSRKVYFTYIFKIIMSNKYNDIKKYYCTFLTIIYYLEIKKKLTIFLTPDKILMRSMF